MVQKVLEVDERHDAIDKPAPIISFDRGRGLGLSVGWYVSNDSFKDVRQGNNSLSLAVLVNRLGPNLAAFFLWSRVHGIVTLLLACDFRGSLPLPVAEICPERLFELSREFLWEGFRPAASPGEGVE